jgi:hypothetical protein
MGNQYGKGFHDGFNKGKMAGMQFPQRPSFGDQLPWMIVGSLIAAGVVETVKIGVAAYKEGQKVRDDLDLAKEMEQILKNKQKNEQENQHKNPLRFVRKE